MRTFLALLGVVVMALFFANADRVSEASLESVVALDAVKASVSVAPAGVEQAGHCAHVPCANSAHTHLPGPCAAHSFVAIGDGWIVPDFLAVASVALKNDRYTGRTLLPPVPPPLA